MNHLKSIISAALLSLSVTANAEPHGSLDASIALDHQTENVLQAIVDGDWQSAASLATKLTQRFPDYSLGRLLYAETLRVTSGLPLKHTSENHYSLDYMGLLLEAQARATQPSAIAGSINPITHSSILPAAIIRSGSSVDSVIVVDLADSYLMLYDTSSEQPKLIKRHYIASGLAGFDKQVEGDLKTPIGIYRIHGFRSDRSLPSLYGSGALMLDYPNALDKLQGRTGSGIWLHGVPHQQKSRAPRSSEGCVTMANDYLLELHRAIELQSTRVVLSNQVQWATPQQLAQRQERLAELFAQYRKAWMDHNLEDLHALYNDGAWRLAAKEHGLTSNIKRVTQNSVVDTKSKHALSLANLDTDTLSLMSVPNAQSPDDRVIEMSFLHGKKNEIHTTLYWRQMDNGQWQIIRERSSNAGV